MPNFEEYEKVVYLQKVDELIRLSQATDTYSLISAAGALRLLLLEGSPLVHRVNRNHKLVLEFEVRRTSAWPPGLQPDFSFEQIDPDQSPDIRPCAKVSLQVLLGQQCLYAEGKSFTVKDVIKQCAHVYGAVHVSAPDEKGEALASLNVFQLLSTPMSIYPMRGIINVITKGLKPLTTAVNTEIHQ